MYEIQSGRKPKVTSQKAPLKKGDEMEAQSKKQKTLFAQLQLAIERYDSLGTAGRVTDPNLRPGATKSENGQTYVLNRNHRWERQDKDRTTQNSLGIKMGQKSLEGVQKQMNKLRAKMAVANEPGRLQSKIDTLNNILRARS